MDDLCRHCGCRNCICPVGTASKLTKLQAQCDVWNAAHPVGTTVVLTRDDDVKIRTETVSEAQVLSGHSAVIWMRGVRGCYLLDRVVAASQASGSESAKAYPTHFPCPNGCGNICNNGDNLAYCPVCRRDLASVEVQPRGTCWAWWGPSDHRMRCRRTKGHEHGHDTHPDDWYAPYPSPALTACAKNCVDGEVDG